MMQNFLQLFNNSVITISAWDPQLAQLKNPPANAGDTGVIFGLGRSLGEGNGNPLQYSCLENLRERGAWWATVHGVTKQLDMT